MDQVALSSEEAVAIPENEGSLKLQRPTHMTTVYQCAVYNDKITNLARRLFQEEHIGIETTEALARLLADRDFFIFHREELMVIQ